MQKAKVFWSGRSQAVRLPKEFRFDAKEVAIRREGEIIILEPLKPSKERSWDWLKKMPGAFDKDFMAGVEEDVPWGPDDPESQLGK